jgi:hypothetical protein
MKPRTLSPMTIPGVSSTSDVRRGNLKRLSMAPMTLVCAAALALGGCKVSTLELLEGEFSEPLVQEYASGAQVTIDGLYGDIFVTRGESGVVSASFKPFNYHAYDESERARRELRENIEFWNDADSAGDISIGVSRHDATNGLGAHVTVELPPEFDGTLLVSNEADGAINTGNIDVSFVGDSTTLNVVNEGLENCNILRPERDDDPVPPSKLTNTDVRCGADITVRGVSDDVVVHSSSSFYSQVLVEIASVSASARGGSISGDDASIEVRLPGGDDFVATATAEDGAVIKNLDLPGSCEALVDQPTSKEVQCGEGGPRYDVVTSDADPDDDDSAFIRLAVQ